MELRSEVVLFSVMILNVFAVGGLLLLAWRRGHLKKVDDTGDILFEGSDDTPDQPLEDPRGS
jgi:hypothetical protein